MSFKFKPLEIPDVILITPDVFGDDRGFFLESYQKNIFNNAGIVDDFVQDNQSKSQHGVIRGLHFQKQPYSQAKLLRCIVGEIYDVVLDIRLGSNFFGRWIGIRLVPHQILYIPSGFAHGFCVVSDTAEISYKTSCVHQPDHECGVIWNDPDLSIPWPTSKPILSEKDKKWSRLKDVSELKL